MTSSIFMKYNWLRLHFPTSLSVFSTPLRNFDFSADLPRNFPAFPPIFRLSSCEFSRVFHRFAARPRILSSFPSVSRPPRLFFVSAPHFPTPLYVFPDRRRIFRTSRFSTQEFSRLYSRVFRSFPGSPLHFPTLCPFSRHPRVTTRLSREVSRLSRLFCEVPLWWSRVSSLLILIRYLWITKTEF